MHTLDCCGLMHRADPSLSTWVVMKTICRSEQSGLPFWDFQNLDCLPSHFILLTTTKATCKGLKILLLKLHLQAKKSGQLVWTLKSRKIAMMCSASIVDHKLTFSSFWRNHVCTPVTGADDCITSETDITSLSLPPLL